MAKPSKTIAMRQLDKTGTPYEPFWYDVPTFDCDEAATVRGLSVSQIVKSLLVELPGKRYCLALLQGDRKLSLHKLGTVTGQKGLTMVKHEEVVTITGYEPGSVCPFGLKRRLTIYLDRAVLEQEVVSISGGSHETEIRLKSADLAKASAARVVDIAQ
ncbi:MAG: aminoacyl-tRNA deacylase [Anaerolineae bacterium]